MPMSAPSGFHEMTVFLPGTVAIVDSTFANLTMTGVSPLITHSQGNQRV